MNCRALSFAYLLLRITNLKSGSGPALVVTSGSDVKRSEPFHVNRTSGLAGMAVCCQCRMQQNINSVHFSLTVLCTVQQQSAVDIIVFSLICHDLN